MIDFLGYIASILILISMLMENMFKFRLINSIACGLFIIYGIIKADTPILLLNGMVILINIYHLFKLTKK
jgi:uncharacterized protein with PQ loop repeat